MDGIQTYAGGQRPLVAAVHPPGPSPSAAKAPSDYLRAIRRRIWLVLAVAIPVATAGTLHVLRMQPVYSVSASIEIKPPRVDPLIKGLLTRGDVGNGDASDEKYIPNTLALLNSKSLAEDVVNDPASGLPASEGDAAELMAKVKYRQIPQSNFYTVSLEGREPDRITRTLNFLLDKFQRRTDTESRDASVQAATQASGTMNTYITQLKSIEDDLTNHIRNSPSLAPGGRNLKEVEYEMFRQRLFSQQQAAKDLQQRAQFDTMKTTASPEMNPARAARIAELEGLRKNLNKRLSKDRRLARDPNDPATQMDERELRDVEVSLSRLQDNSGAAEGGPTAAQVYETVLSDAIGEIRSTEGQLSTALTEMKEAMPEFHKYTTLMSEREQKFRQVADLKEKLAAFTMLSATQKSPVKVVDLAAEPSSPLRPNRPAYIVGCIIFSLGLGLALVCFLEHIDHSVKVPEHLTAGLSLPLFGVVPRMLRNARNHRGGHLWTPGTPDSVEADAYRNLRASLLGATQATKPIVTLLVTSAKAGEGKSTTALNLAATCARAGERTLLMDVDLRRPSLNDVFHRTEGTGLVDVLRGDLPWQRTVVQTDLPNLDFLPTGDTRDVPIEVLGSLELRQLLISLSEHHYDRVILDGPAVLGLADCRMLGRIVDAAVMVVRSGSQELRPLQRAKTMLEQSQVHIVGVVFNGLYEDLQNWSSYGPNPLLDSSPDFANARPAGVSRGLDAPPSRAAALMARAPAEA